MGEFVQVERGGEAPTGVATIRLTRPPPTKESVGNANLLLVNGTITVAAPAPVPALSTWALIILATALAFVATRFRI